MYLAPFRRQSKLPKNRHNKLPSEDAFKMDDSYYEEISNLAGVGGWCVNFMQKASFFDKQARQILEVPEDFTPSLKQGYRFYAKEHLEFATSLFFNCSQGIPFNEEIKMVTYTNKVFWAKTRGTPLRDEKNNIIGVRGFFQDINSKKKREIKFKQSLEIIDGHNKRLYNFAHSVSHSLRSHVSNLQLSTTLFETESLNNDQLDLFNNFKLIGENLELTLSHLNEIMAIQAAPNQNLQRIHFKSVLDDAVASIKQMVLQSGAVFYTEFSEVEQIDYLACYLESILRNLITNAIKHKHPDRDPEINIFTYKEEGVPFLVVKDNGLGMDLEKYGDKVFDMPQTVHFNENEQGHGLFLVKSRVESLGGKLTVKSKLGKCTQFIIQLRKP